MDEFDLESVDSLGTTVDDLIAIGRVLEAPRLAHIWFTLQVEGNITVEESGENPFTWDGMTVDEIAEHTRGEIPQSTLYSDMDELVNVGAVRVESEGQPLGYSAKFFQAEGENVDEIGKEVIVGPQIIGLVGEAYVDDAVQQFLDQYSHGRLYEAIQLYEISVTDDYDYDMDVTDVYSDVTEADYEAIIPAIERVLTDLSRDPLWGADYRPELSHTS